MIINLVLFFIPKRQEIYRLYLIKKRKKLAYMRLNSNSKKIYANNITDLNNPPNYVILNTNVNPIGLPSGLRSNGCLVIQQNSGAGKYTAQLAFSFGSDKIAIRRKSGTDSWSEWKYFTAQ